MSDINAALESRLTELAALAKVAIPQYGSGWTPIDGPSRLACAVPELIAAIERLQGRVAVLEDAGRQLLAATPGRGMVMATLLRGAP